MERLAPENESLTGVYREALRADPATGKSVRNFCFLAGLIITLFIPIELFVFPDQFAFYLSLRLGVNLALAYVYYFTSHTHPIEGAQAMQLAIGAMIVAMITTSGAGIASEYASGLIFIFCAFPILAPLSVQQISLSIVPTLVAFLIFPQLADPVELSTYGLNALFPIVGVLAGLASTSALDAARFSEFAKRHELERARDALKALDAAKSRFTANVHHELRTPLTLVLAPLEAMLGGAMGTLPNGLAPMLESMRSNGLRLLKLINNLLDLSRIENQQMRIRRRPIRVAEVLEEIARGARGMADRKGIALTVRIEGELPLIHVDSDALDKILVNLTGNALKFTPAGGTIELCAAPHQRGIHLTVSDSGIGIPPDQLSRVFDRFAQVDMSESRQYEGTGIGLSLVRELVELHHGEVWAESEGAGHGSALHVLLPVGEDDVEEAELLIEGRDDVVGRAFAAVEAESSRGAEPQGYAEVERDLRRHESTAACSPATGDESAAASPERSAEILIVEDNADMRELLRTLLAPEFHVRLARNGSEALEAVAERHPDAVLSDVMMPGMTGLELTTALKQRPETAAIPVILVTSKAEREMRAEGLERGADDYVTKPFHPRELLARVRTFARLRRLQRTLEHKNRELADTLEELRIAQTRLVHREKMSALGQLVAGVAHEINTPVSFIQGNFQFLEQYVSVLLGALRRWETAAAREPALQADCAHSEALRGIDAIVAELESILDGMREGVERTIEIVHDLRTFSRLDRSEVGELDLGGCLDGTLQLLAARLQGVTVVREYDVTPSVTCLPRHLRQVFMNLLCNAADAVAGHGRVIVRKGLAERERVFIEIEDDGPGIPDDLLDRIFDPFFTTKDVGKGTGLGLAISHEIVDRHGGALSIRSRVGHGTCIRVEVPIRPRASDLVDGPASSNEPRPE